MEITVETFRVPIMMRVLLIAAILAVIGVIPAPAHAQWWKDRYACRVSEHNDGKGKNWIIDTGQSYSYVGGKWNDKISSVVCVVFCRLTAWEHRDYQGATVVFDENTRNVGGAWNDRISSLSVECDK